jgi:hypothetical protein
MSLLMGLSRHFAAKQQFGRQADMRAADFTSRAGWSHCAPATAALESGAYAQRAAGEQDAAIRTRNAPMRIEEHIDANE